MTNGQKAKRRRYWLLYVAVGVMLFAIYMGVYYATYTMPRGIMVGTVPHYQYKIGSLVLPADLNHRARYLDSTVIHATAVLW